MPFREFARSLVAPQSGRVGFLASLTLAVSLSSCSDDSTCTSPYYATVASTLDSVRYVVRTPGGTVHGRVVGEEETRVRNFLGGPSWGPSTWGSKPRVRSHLASLVGTLVVGGRLGHADTSVYYEVDSVSVLPGDGRSAAIRMEFRSVVGSVIPYYASHAASDLADTSATYWNLRGRVECSLPIEADLAKQDGFTCVLDAAGEEATSLRMGLQVSKTRDEYPCSEGNVVY